jgi:hypothetical protein
MNVRLTNNTLIKNVQCDMNYIDTIKAEIKQYFNPNNANENSDETVFSPNNKYRVNTKSFRQEKPNCNWDVTKIEVYQNDSSTLLFSCFVNEGIFFHSWVTKNNVDYLLCAEDLCGGQTVIDLTNKVMASYTTNDDGFIWTKHLLSPNEDLLAVFGCVWGTAFFVTVYHFDKPMDLPLKIAYEPNWTGYDIIEWIDNKTLKVETLKGQIEKLEL